MPPWRIQHESHTCSETSLRILMWNTSDVQKTLQLNLTGDIGYWVTRSERTMRRKSFNVLAKRVNLFWCSSFKQGQIVVFLMARWFLGYPRPISEIWHENGSRYVKGTSPFDITVTSGRLRWHRKHSHTCAPCWVLEVLQLFRCYTRTTTHLMFTSYLKKTRRNKDRQPPDQNSKAPP